MDENAYTAVGSGTLCAPLSTGAFSAAANGNALAARATGRQSRHRRTNVCCRRGTPASGGAMGAAMVGARAIRSHSSRSVASMGGVYAQFST